MNAARHASSPTATWAGRILLALAAACSRPAPAHPAEVDIESAHSWEAADVLFTSDPRWIGGDGALSIPLGDERTLWLFGDSFVATSDARDRKESEMVRNTVALQQGLDPRNAEMEFVWRTEADGTPGPFFADEGELWFWPGHGIRLEEGPLLVFMMAVRATPEQGLGFTEAGYRVVVIDEPDLPPLQWKLKWFDPGGPQADPNVSLGTSVLREGDELYAVATARGSKHEGWLARFSIPQIVQGHVEPLWWAGESRGWISSAELRSDAPAPIAPDVGAENSVHHEPRVAGYLHVATRGFGATTIAVRTSAALTGPFSDPCDVFTPPESRGPAPFVYAAKAHPELTTDDPRDLVLTYATNSFDFGDLFTESGQTDLYYPRFVILRFAE